MADNSYAQLIDDYENGILVEPGETLTQYIDRMGGVDYKADGGAIGIEVLFQPKREEYQTGGISEGNSTSLASLQRQGYTPATQTPNTYNPKTSYDARASMQDYASALKNVSGGRTYQQLDDLKAYARNLAADQLKTARFDKSPRGLGELYDKYFKGKATLGGQAFNFGRTSNTMDQAYSYNLKDKNQILDDMAQQIMVDQQSYEVQKLNQQRIADKKAAQQASREQQYADYMNNLVSSTYGKADDYKAEARTLGMPTAAYFDYLTTSDPKDVMTSYDTLSRNPYFDPKTYVPTDYSNPETPRPPSPYEVYFQQELQNQIRSGIPQGQRIQQGQVLGLPTVLTGPPQSGTINPGYQPYEVALAQTKKQLGLKQGGRVGYDIGGLTGQAKNIYDSWISAGHSEADVLAYLESRGLYNPQDVGITSIVNTQKPIIPQGDGGDGDGGNTITPYDPNVNLGPNKDVIDYEADAYNIGPTFRGQFARLRNAYNNIPTPFNIAKMGWQKAKDWADDRRIEKENAAAAAEAALQAQITAQAHETATDLVSKGASRDWGKTETRDSSGWKSSPFAKGGLATMFTRRR